MRESYILAFQFGQQLQRAVAPNCPECRSKDLIVPPVRVDQDDAGHTLTCIKCRHAWQVSYRQPDQT